VTSNIAENAIAHSTPSGLQPTSGAGGGCSGAPSASNAASASAAAAAFSALT
jgi:hypothetical protein